MASESDLKDLLLFLSAERADVKLQAFEAVLAFSEHSVLLDFLKKDENDKVLTKALLRVIGDPNTDLARLSLKIMTNLAETQQFAERFIKSKAIPRVMESLRQQSRAPADEDVFEELHLMLLANLSQQDVGKAAILQLNEKDESLRGVFLNTICDLYLRPIQASVDREEGDRYVHALHILINLSAHKKGREQLLSKGAPLISALLTYVHNTSTAETPIKYIIQRRDLSLQLLYNLCVDKDTHSVLSDLSSIGIDCNNNLTNIDDSLSDDEDDDEDEDDAIQSSIPVLCRIGAALLPPPGDKRRRLKAHTTVKDGMIGGGISGESSGGITTEIIEEEVENLEVHSFIKKHSSGPPSCIDARRSLLSCVQQLLSTKEGREGGRRVGLFDVLRVWDLSEDCTQIKEGISEIVHLLVYSEEELEEQDREMKREEEEKKKKAEEEKNRVKEEKEVESPSTSSSTPVKEAPEEEVEKKEEKSVEEEKKEEKLVDDEEISVCGLFEDISSDEEGCETKESKTENTKIICGLLEENNDEVEDRMMELD